jgi:hypothetical protein
MAFDLLIDERIVVGTVILRPMTAAGPCQVMRFREPIGRIRHHRPMQRSTSNAPSATLGIN